MIVISHRGRLSGSIDDTDNTIGSVNLALGKGFDVEVDIWGDIDGTLALGHDRPEEPVSIEYLSNSKLWVHAKNQSALGILYGSEVNYFFHQDDAFTVTSKGYPWGHLDTDQTINNAIYCAFTYEELITLKGKVSTPLGICTDIPQFATEIFSA